MKITDVRSIQPFSPTSPPDWRTTLGQILVAVDTDVGFTGYGVGGGGLAGVHVVRTVLRDVLLGRDPEDVEKLWQAMYDATLAFGRKGLAIMALSGVDLALWDLKGKAAKLPVARLLGGRVDWPIPVYVTVWGDITPEQAASYRGFKLHVEDAEPAEVVRQVEKVRAAVGSERPLMVDAWMRWDVKRTLEVASAAPGLAWIEEPLPVDDVAGYVELARRSPVPIAGGEHEFTARGFAELIDRRLHQVLTPDVCWCGGLTELRKIYWLAKSAGLRVCQHRGSEVWGLHAIAAFEDDPLAESGRPWMTWVGGQPQVENGFIRLTDAPGFGVRIDEEKLQAM